MVRISRPVRPLTGSTMRMACLPHADYSDPEVLRHSCEREAFGPTGRASQPQAQTDEDELVERKFVYKNDDKYKFRRILQADCLVFDSHFESGNLHSACRVFRPSYTVTNKQEYDLLLQHDIHSYGHMQWFYFSVNNTTAGTEVQFNVTNFVKSDSMFNDGMKPLIYSKLGRSKSGVGWRRCGHDIQYFENGMDNLTKTSKQGGGSFHTLVFKHVFDHSDDICYFAYCYPYTYTDLQRYLCTVQMNPDRGIHMRRKGLCRTLGDNNCDVLSITAPTSSLREFKQRLGVVLTARVHPGESNSSWMMHGIIDFLTSDHLLAQKLRARYIFKIVPMMNPDGVINGNYRTSLAGVDLNRRWDNPVKTLHPTIFHTKRLIQRFQRTHQVVLVVDFHGHSRKEGVFMYGNMPTKELFRAQRSNPKLDEMFNWKVRVLPRVWASRSPLFHLSNCTFSVQKDKLNTMRVVTFSQCNIDCTYTVEASLAGANGQHFIPQDLIQMGHDFCQSLDDFYWLVAPASEIRKSVDEARSESSAIRQEIIERRVGDDQTSLQDPVTILPSTAWATLTDGIGTGKGNGNDSGGSDPEFSDDCRDETDLARSLRRRGDAAGEAASRKPKLKKKKKKKKAPGTTSRKQLVQHNESTAGTTRRRTVSAVAAPSFMVQTLEVGKPPRPGKSKSARPDPPSGNQKPPRRRSTSSYEPTAAAGRLQKLEAALAASAQDSPADILAQIPRAVRPSYVSEDEEDDHDDLDEEDDDGEDSEVEAAILGMERGRLTEDSCNAIAVQSSSNINSHHRWAGVEKVGTSQDTLALHQLLARSPSNDLSVERETRPRAQSAASGSHSATSAFHAIEHDALPLSTARQKSRIEQVISERRAREIRRPQSAMLPGTGRRNTVGHNTPPIPAPVNRRSVTHDQLVNGALPMLNLRVHRSAF